MLKLPSFLALPSIFNAVILVAVLSVGNSSTFATSRTLTALAGYGQAPRFLMYIDREGRPLISLLIVLVFGCLAYINLSSDSSTVFDWLYAISGLSVIFTWGSICFAHIRFRQAWKAQGHTVEELPFKAPLGVYGSWFGGLFNVLILIAQFYVAVWPIGESPNANSFFLAYLAAPIILVYVSTLFLATFMNPRLTRKRMIGSSWDISSGSARSGPSSRCPTWTSTLGAATSPRSRRSEKSAPSSRRSPSSRDGTTSCASLSLSLPSYPLVLLRVCACF